jgi:hypothetical protein
MQGHTQCDQSPRIAPRVGIMFGDHGKVAGHDLDDVSGDFPRLSTTAAEAVKSQVLLRLAE